MRPEDHTASVSRAGSQVRPTARLGKTSCLAPEGPSGGAGEQLLPPQGEALGTAGDHQGQVTGGYPLFSCEEPEFSRAQINCC